MCFIGHFKRRRFMVYCDNNPNILEWGSEEIIIPYKSPFLKKVHRYFPDFFIKYKNSSEKSFVKSSKSNQRDIFRHRKNLREKLRDISVK